MVNGIIPALITPFEANGEIGFSKLKDLLEFLIGNGVQGVFASGTNGEGPLLSIEERIKLFEEVAEIVNKRVPVIAQIGDITTKNTIYLGKKAIDAGVDAVAIVTPYYFKLSDNAIKSHFINIAENLFPTPVYLYNLPENTGNYIKPEIAKEIMETNSNIIGIKDSSKDFMMLEDFISTLPSNIDILVGTDSFILPALLMGAKGAISALANSFPELCVGIYRDFLAGRYQEGLSKQILLHKIRAITKQMPSISALKIILKYRGIDVGEPRAPLGTVSLAQEELLKRILKEVREILV